MKAYIPLVPPTVAVVILIFAVLGRWETKDIGDYLIQTDRWTGTVFAFVGAARPALGGSSLELSEALSWASGLAALVACFWWIRVARSCMRAESPEGENE